MVYAPIGRPFTVRLSKISANDIKAWWFNPRNGDARLFLTFSNNKGEREFVPPEPGEMVDWVLVLEDASKGYPPPVSDVDMPGATG